MLPYHFIRSKIPKDIVKYILWDFQWETVETVKAKYDKVMNQIDREMPGWVHCFRCMTIKRHPLCMGRTPVRMIGYKVWMNREDTWIKCHDCKKKEKMINKRLQGRFRRKYLQHNI